MWILKTFFSEFFLRQIDGITLFLPQDIIISKSFESIELKVKFETGVNLGGINFQKLFS